jgi:hypothetical protein
MSTGSRPEARDLGGETSEDCGGSCVDDNRGLRTGTNGQERAKRPEARPDD